TTESISNPQNLLFLQSISRNSAPTAQTGHVPEIVGHLRRNTQKVRDAIHGNSIWDDKMFAGLVHKMETASV
ncbi:MAG: hypothetical protein WA159_12430, partial [Variovorax sp.]